MGVGPEINISKTLYIQMAIQSGDAARPLPLHVLTVSGGNAQALQQGTNTVWRG